MDASTIRLILIVVGGLLILVLVLWERFREKRRGQKDDVYLEEDEDLDATNDAYESRYDPKIGRYDDEEDAEEEADDPYPAHSRSFWSQTSLSADPPIDDDPPDSEDTGVEEEPKPVSGMSRPDPLLIQLSVSARRYPFKGTDLMEVAERCGLYPGEMDIFHCLDEFDDRTRVYFSMANMIKPGSFPFDSMESFTTPGLMLFAQLEGDPEDMTILDEMIATARKLALALNGDVLDDSRRPLTVKKEEDMRQAVLDNEMIWAKAVMR
jgi:cell division protein ZipA